MKRKKNYGYTKDILFSAFNKHDKIGPIQETVDPLYLGEGAVGPTSENPRYSSGSLIALWSLREAASHRIHCTYSLYLPQV